MTVSCATPAGLDEHLTKQVDSRLHDERQSTRRPADVVVVGGERR
jgi:hypothetical protein